MLTDKPWRVDAVGRLVGGIFAGLVLGMLLDGVVTPMLKGWAKGDLEFIHFLISTLCFQGTVLGLIGFFLWENGLNWGEAFGFTNPGRLRAVALALVAGFVVLVGALELGWLSAEVMSHLGVPPEPQQAVQLMQTTVSVPRQILYGAVAILLAPLAEELLFRGVLYPTVKQLGYPRLALWGTSLLFAAIHFNLMSLVPLVFVAAVLTLLYEHTNNLLAPILTHSLFNAANFALLLNEREVSHWLHWYYERI
jgi:membrane protease YdiL (CAAX protease family)